MPGAGPCWFCRGPAVEQERYSYRVGLHRQPRTYFWVVAVYETWESATVDVPRCRRCCVGHYLDGLLCALWIVLLACAAIQFFEVVRPTVPLSGLSAVLLGLWLVPLAAWWMLGNGWLGLRRWFPHDRSYVRRHPAVRRMLTAGWQYGRAPMGHWRRWIG